MRSILWQNYLVYDLATPVGVNHFWGFGFTLGMLYLIQVFSGVFLSFFYTSSSGFLSVSTIMGDVCFGEMARVFHSTCVSVIFLCLYLHVFRGVWSLGFKLVSVWWTGVVVFFLFVIISFLGYVLTWSQMSFWAATVITDLSTALPVIGSGLAKVLWGGLSLSGSTLLSFYSLHYLLPFVLFVFIFLHIMFLHLSHSHSFVQLKTEVVKFFPFFLLKDLVMFMALVCLLTFFSSFFPFLPLESDMFSLSSSVLAPEHIVPEWYFLPFYAVLRAVPSKFGGVVLMFMVFVFVLLLSFSRGLVGSGVFWGFSLSFVLLLFLSLFVAGSWPVIYPFGFAGGFLVFLFFLCLFFLF